MLCMDSHLEPLLLLMIVTPHPVHTHSRSSLYIYKVLEHLQQWLRVIEMSLTPHPRKTHSYHRVLCLSWNNNHEITSSNVVSFRHSSRHVMSPCRRHERGHVTNTTQHVCKWRLGKTWQIKTFPAKLAGVASWKYREDMSPTRHNMSANEGLEKHDRLRHSLLSLLESLHESIDRRYDHCLKFAGGCCRLHLPSIHCKYVFEFSSFVKEQRQHQDPRLHKR
jgi:hypothetical protein